MNGKKKGKRKKDLKKILSERVKQLSPTIFHELHEMAVEKKGVISLGPGEPDFITPKYILDYVKEILYKGYTHYSPPGGRSELKETIRKKVRRENKIKLKGSDNIIVTCGSTESILLALSSVVDPTEEVLYPNPGYFAYGPMVEMIDAQATPYVLDEETGFQPDPDEIKKKVSRKTMAIILNSPSNPTGTVFKKKLLEEIADIAIDNDLMIISDEAYEHLTYEDAHVSIGSLNGMKEHVITNFSFSKSYAMAGWRVGYAIGPEWVIKNMTRIHLYSSICAPTISQIAATKALAGQQKDIGKMRQEYAKRRKFILKRIDEIDGLDVKVKPCGAFYAFPRFGFKMNSTEFSRMLIEKANVITIPGSEFGSNGEGFIRLSYATSLKLIEKAMNQIEEYLGYLKSTA